MPVFQIDVEKNKGAEFWTNVYFVSETSLTAANDRVADFVTAEQAFHFNTVTFTKARCRDRVAGTEQFIITPLSVSGLLNDPGTALPLFNVVRVDLGVLGLGRPSRKYYRTGAGTLNMTSEDRWAATYLDEVFDALLALRGVDTVAWCDTDGQFVQTIQVQTKIGMRQLRRGSRRSAQPVL